MATLDSRLGLLDSLSLAVSFWIATLLILTWAIACAFFVLFLLLLWRIEYRIAYPTVLPGVQRPECLPPHRNKRLSTTGSAGLAGVSRATLSPSGKATRTQSPTSPKAAI
jgi:hypothetical protein